MELSLLQSLVTLTEAKDEAKPKAKIAKEPQIAADDAANAPADEPKDTNLAPDKTAFFFRPKFDIYVNLEQTEDQELRRETKRVYSIFGREHERGAVYGVTSGSQREFARAARALGISTDGEVTLERVKRAGFTTAGRIGTKRLLKRGDFVVSLVGPTDDSVTITFYTAKPLSKEKVTESQDQDLFTGDIDSVIEQVNAAVEQVIESKASPSEITALKAKIRHSLGHDSFDDADFMKIGKAQQAVTKRLHSAGY